MEHNNQSETLPLVIVTGEGPTILGRNWLEKIQLNCTQTSVIFHRI